MKKQCDCGAKTFTEISRGIVSRCGVRITDNIKADT